MTTHPVETDADIASRTYRGCGGILRHLSDRAALDFASAGLRVNNVLSWSFASGGYNVTLSEDNHNGRMVVRHTFVHDTE